MGWKPKHKISERKIIKILNFLPTSVKEASHPVKNNPPSANMINMMLFLSFVALLSSCAGKNVESRKLLWGNEIKTEEGQSLGRLEIYEGEEAINVVDAFVQNVADVADLGNSVGFRSNILDIVCAADSITCSTRVPLVYRKIINDEHGKNLGAIEIYENEEVIDATVRFLRQSKVSVDEIALKNYMFEQACGLARVRCTRNVAVVYNQMINESDGSPIDRLVIYDNEEPADKVFKWCKENNVVKYYDCEYVLLACSSLLFYQQTITNLLIPLPLCLCPFLMNVCSHYKFSV